jgi:hypothetical protein
MQTYRCLVEAWLISYRCILPRCNSNSSHSLEPIYRKEQKIKIQKIFEMFFCQKEYMLAGQNHNRFQAKNRQNVISKDLQRVQRIASWDLWIYLRICGGCGSSGGDVVAQLV